MFNQQAQEILCSSLGAEDLISLQHIRKLQSTSSPSREKMRLVKQLGRNEKEVEGTETIEETSEPLTKDIIADVLSKVLCVIANLSMIEKNGCLFAGSEDFATSLQYLISCSTVQNDEELVLNVISVLANISYYQMEMGKNYILEIAERFLHVVPFLFSGTSVSSRRREFSATTQDIRGPGNHTRVHDRKLAYL